MLAKRTQQNKGFSFLELAITLVAVGALVTVVSYGKALIARSAYQQIISDINLFSKATGEFYQLYGGLPGDIKDVSTLPLSAKDSGGNGNLNIDSPSEAVNFWFHLSQAGFIKGLYSGKVSDQYITPHGGKAGGLPVGPLEGSAYSIVVNSKNGLEVRLGGLDATTNRNDLGVMPPKELLALDLKLDDGIPGSGVIKGFPGSDYTSEDCVVQGEYAKGNSPACIGIFSIRGFDPGVSGQEDNVTCNGAPLGSIRQSENTDCPAGMEGAVYEVCQKVTKTSAAFVATDYRCKPVTCSGNIEAGNSYSLACPAGYTGSVTATCDSYGVYNYTNDCSPILDSCEDDFAGKALPCPLGESGVRVLWCNNGTWAVDAASTSCTALTVGAVSNSIVTGNCSDLNPYYTGEVYYVYAMPVDGDAAASPYNSYPPRKLVHHNCKPKNSDNCTAGSTRDIGCPAGEEGTHTQFCAASGTLYTAENNCQTLTCSGASLGAIKLDEYNSCSSGYVGARYLICALADANEAEWQAVDSSVTCTQARCPVIPPDNSFNHRPAWGSGVYYSGASYNPSGCAPGCINCSYKARYCGIDGNWSVSTGGQFCTAN